MKDLPATDTPLMVLCCLYANDSHRHVSRPLFPAQTSIPDCLFDISIYTSNTHLKCDLFKTKLLIFSPKLVSLPPFSSSGLSCHLFVAQVNYFRVMLIFFFSFIFYIYTIRKSCALCAQNISSIPPLLITPLV